MTNSKIAELINEDNFKNVLINELYALIDEEMLKDDMDCELVDQLVLAIEELENIDETDKVIALPLVLGSTTSLAKRIRHKTNRRNTLIRITACAAAISILFAGTNAYLVNTGDTSLITEVRTLVKKIGNFLTGTITDTESTTESSSESTTIVDEISHIELVVADNFKTSYLWQEQLNLDGLQVFVVYDSGEKEEISLDQCSILGYNPTKVGEQTVTVKYNEFIASFNITVSKTEQNDTSTRTITNIECDATNKELIVPKGTENPAVAEKVRYRYVYSDGTFSTWTLCKDAELVSEYDSQLIDTPQVLTYRAPNGMEFTVTVLVYDNTVPEEKIVTKLEVYKMPQAMKYYASNHDKYYLYVDNDCDFSEFQIKVYYDDRTTEIKTLGDGEIQAFGTMSTERPSSYSGYTITFAYGDATTTFKYEVIVKPEIQSYSFEEGIWECYYVKDAPKEFNAKGIVKAKMNDSNKEVYLDVEVKGYDPNKIGYIELQVYYEGEYLGDYIGGYIYGDTGFAILSRPLTERISKPNFKFKPYVIAAKCVGDGKFETYGDIKYKISDNPTTDPNINFESGATGELKAMGITGFRCNCTDSAIVYYTISADDYITEFGTHQAMVYLYNVSTVDNGWTYQRDSIAEDLSYTLTIKEKPSYYYVEAPKNLKINIQDIYSEFYDKLHVYAIYEDGRKEEVFDYNIMRYLPSRPTTSSCLRVYLTYPDGNGYFIDVYVYSEGYEDSFYITCDDRRKEEENYYLVGTSLPDFNINFRSAEGVIDTIYTKSNSIYDIDDWEIEGWDTSTPGEYEATITYHSDIGDIQTKYKYVVVESYLDRKFELVFNKELTHYDMTKGFTDGSYKVVYTDTIGKQHIIKEYDIVYDLDFVTVTFLDPNGYYGRETLTYKWQIPENIAVAGKCENLVIKQLDDGNIKISLDCPYLPENGTMLYDFTYPAEKKGWITVHKHIESNTPEVIIDKNLILPDQDNYWFCVYVYIVDDETNEKYQVLKEYVYLD